MKPMIAILPLVDIDRKSFWMLPGYMDGVIEAGGLPIMLPLTLDTFDIEYFAKIYDGFIFPGGQDVNPRIYGEEKSEKCGMLCEPLDEMSRLLFDRLLKADKPILGICRGIQIINVMLGGTLYQDLPTERSSDLDHRMNPPYDRAVHHVTIVNQSPLHQLLGKRNMGVNSYHHQAIKKLSGQLSEMAVADDGLVEAVYMPGKRFIWGVQWHPEFSYQTDADSKLMLKEFVRNCENRGNLDFFE